MAKIVIKKRVSLEFLGDEYKDSHLTFKSMSLKEYEKLLEAGEELSNKDALLQTIKILKDHFIEGKFMGEDVTSDDLDDFDIGTLVTCLEYFTGQKLDPKVELP